MRRTLFTVLAFLACALGVGIGADELLDTSPDQPATVEQLDLTDRVIEPVGRES